MQREIRDFCRETGLLFCGPNCVGYANITDGVGMYSAPLPRAFRKGSIGVIAQSGAVLLGPRQLAPGSRVFPAHFLGKRSRPRAGRLHGLPCG